MTRAELKKMAKAQLKGKVGLFFLCNLIIALVGVACGFIPIIGALVLFIITPPFSIGLILVYLDATKGEKAKVERVFDGFKYTGKSILLMVLVGIFTFLWSLLLYIPGIIKAISYSMSFYILADNPQMKASEALDESKAIMHGHKMDYFVLGLSFIPWILLVAITFGIAAIWVAPYMQLTVTNFYNSIKRVSEVAPAEEAAVEL